MRTQPSPQPDARFDPTAPATQRAAPLVAGVGTLAEAAPAPGGGPTPLAAALELAPSRNDLADVGTGGQRRTTRPRASRGPDLAESSERLAPTPRCATVGEVIDGPPIGVGRTAEVYDAGDGTVVKLLHPGAATEALTAEAAKTQAAHDAGVAAPATHGRVCLHGRVGYVFDRVDGAVMLDELQPRLERHRRYATLLASVHADIHRRHSAALPDVKALLAAKIDAAPALDAAARRAAKDRLSALEDGDRVLHGDLHPGNVLLADAGPVVIDWIDAAQGSPAADVARTLWLLTPAAAIPPASASRTEVARLRLFRSHYLARYTAITGTTPGQLHPWRLPVLAARLAEGINHETERVLSEISRLINRT